MGFLKGIGKAFKKIASGVMKFAKSPFGKMLLNVGLGMLTGGVGGIASKLLGGIGGNLLGGIGGKLAGMMGSGGFGNLFGGLAKNFLGDATSWLSKAGLGGIANFAKQAASSGDLLGMVKNLFTAKDQTASQPDIETQRIANSNLQNLIAHRQAQMLMQQYNQPQSVMA